MANEHVGARQEIAFKVESTRGTAVDPASGDWFSHTGQGFIPMSELIRDDSAKGRIEDVNTADLAKEFSQGSVSMRLHDDFLTNLNRLIFGAAGSVVDTVTTYTVENTNLHNSFTITTSDPVVGDKQYTKGMLSTATIQINTDDYVGINMELFAGKEGSATVTPGYSTTSDLFRPSEVTFGYADDFAGLASPTAFVVKNANINVEKNVEIDWATGSTEPDEIVNGRFGINGDVTITHDSSTYRTLALEGTQKAIVITLNNGAFKWELKFPSVKFENWNRETDINGQVTESWEFKPNYNDPTNGLVQGVVTDLT